MNKIGALVDKLDLLGLKIFNILCVIFEVLYKNIVNFWLKLISFTYFSRN